MILFKALFSKKTAIIGIVLLAVLLLLPQFLPRFYIYLFALIFAICLLAPPLLPLHIDADCFASFRIISDSLKGSAEW